MLDAGYWVDRGLADSLDFVGFDGLRRTSQNFTELRWTPLDIDEPRWTTMDYAGLRWTTLDSTRGTPQGTGDEQQSSTLSTEADDVPEQHSQALTPSSNQGDVFSGEETNRTKRKQPDIQANVTHNHRTVRRRVGEKETQADLPSLTSASSDSAVATKPTRGRVTITDNVRRISWNVPSLSDRTQSADEITNDIPVLETNTQLMAGTEERSTSADLDYVEETSTMDKTPQQKRKMMQEQSAENDNGIQEPPVKKKKVGNKSGDRRKKIAYRKNKRKK